MYKLNADGSFMSAEEIVADLLIKEYDSDMIEAILNGFELPDGGSQMGQACYRMAYYEFLRWIRNAYGLWDKSNPYVVLNPAPNEDNIIDHPLFPDNFSDMVMRLFMRRFKDEHSGSVFTL